MSKEIEIKILEINPIEIKKHLRASKAKFIKEVFQKNYFFENSFTKKNHVAVRLRCEGYETTLTIKSGFKILNNHKTVDEHESGFSSPELAEKMLENLGLKLIRYLEIKREYWKFYSCSIEICKIPKIPVYLEIEGSQKNIAKVADFLGFSKKDYFPGQIMKHYRRTEKILKFT